VGTVLYALGIGPLVHRFLPMFTIRKPETPVVAPTPVA